MIVGINASLLLDLMIWIIFEFFRFIREGFKIPTNPPASHSGIPLSPLPCLQRKTHFMHNLDIFQIMGTLYGLSGHFADHLDTFQIILILCTASGYFQDHPEAFQIIQTLSTSSKHFSENRGQQGTFIYHPDTFEIVLTLCRPFYTLIPALLRTSGSFSDHLDDFEIIWKLLRSSGKNSDHPDKLQTMWTLC